MLGDLRKTLSRARRDARIRLFGNYHSELVNYRYWRYRRHCRKRFKPNGAAPQAASGHAKGFLGQGYEVMAPPAAYSQDALWALKEKVDRLFAEQTGGFRVSETLYRLVDGLELVPEIVDFVDDELEQTLVGYFGSQFKIYSVSFYRTVPTEVPPQSSFLWHVDNVPTGEIKLMVYLDDVKADTGAFRIKPRQTTLDLFAQGYRDRWSMSGAAEAVENSATTRTIEGGPGTRILFENGDCLHKATSPERHHRDVVSFVIIPSDMHWRVSFARNRHLLSTNAGICVDPFRDLPEDVGYQY